MNKSKTMKFESSAMLLGVDQDPKHDDVKLLHKLLRRFGYLCGGAYEPGYFCRHTESAVRRFHGLTVDGLAGAKTRAVLMQPRCSLPDETTSASFALRGAKYPSTRLTYTFVNDAGDMVVQVLSHLQGVVGLGPVTEHDRYG